MSSVNLTLDYPLEGTFLTRHSNLSNLKFLMSLYVLNFSNNLSTTLLIFIIKVKNIHSCKEVYFLTTSPKTVVVLSQLRYSFILKILVPLIYFFSIFSLQNQTTDWKIAWWCNHNWHWHAYLQFGIRRGGGYFYGIEAWVSWQVSKKYELAIHLSLSQLYFTN